MQITNEETKTDAEAIAEAGYLLYGDRYQASLARDLGVNRRMVGFWASGSKPVTSRRWQQIADLLEQRAYECWNLAPAIRRAGQ